MSLDLTSLFPDLEALTPDGRWNALQGWLKDNPEYGENVDRWASQTREQVFQEICEAIMKKYGSAGVMVANLIKPKIMRTIEILQACYRERANLQIEKEIKNVRPKRIASPKRRGQSKRTDQA